MNDDRPILVVDDASAGARLDAFLAAGLGVSRGEARRRLETGGVLLDGRPAGTKQKGRILAAGQVVAVSGRAQHQQMPNPRADLPLGVLAEGPGWVAVDKPAGMPVHPLRDDEDSTVLNAAIARWPELGGVGEGGLRSGVVHRLDVQTSGALLLATEQTRWEHLRRAFSEHRITKIYRALVHGRLTGSGHWAMDLRIARHRPALVRVADSPDAPGVRHCDLRWRAVEHFGDAATLLEVQLGTGFLHQIRVMMAHRGHPVLGDEVYGSPTPGVQRQMLHAARVAVDDVRAESPDPPDLAAAIARLRQP